MKTIYTLLLAIIGLSLLGLAFSPAPSYVRENEEEVVLLATNDDMIGYDTVFLDTIDIEMTKYYSFLAQANDVISIKARKINFIGFGLSLIGPDEIEILRQEISGPEDIIRIKQELSSGGLYQIRIDGNLGEVFGICLQKLNSYDNLQEIHYGIHTNSHISQIAEMKAFSFTGEEGDVIRIRGGEFSDDMRLQIELYNPNGELVEADSIPGLAEYTVVDLNATLGVNGRYTILVMNKTLTPLGSELEFGVSVIKVNTLLENQVLTDTFVCSSIENYGEMLAYTILAHQEDQLVFKFADYSPGDGGPIDGAIQLDFYDSSGGLIGNIDNEEDGFKRFDGSFGTDGYFNVLIMNIREFYNPNRVFGLSIVKKNNENETAEITSDTTISGYIDKHAEIDSYKIFGRKGETLGISFFENSAIVPQLELYSPTGVQMPLSIGGPNSTDEIPIDTTGIYTIFVMDRSSSFDEVNPYTLTISGIGTKISRTQNPTICPKDTFEFQGHLFYVGNDRGNVLVEAQNEEDPDTIYNIALSFYPNPLGMVFDTFCLGRDITIEGVLFNQLHTKDSILLTDSSSHGCDSTIYVDIFYDITCNYANPSPELIIPNIFTPNNDGFNDEFVIPLLMGNPTQYPNSHLIIYDRWKQKVFENKDYHNSGPLWDGINMFTGEPLPMGAYYYFFQLGGEDGRERTGLVTIMR